MNHFNSFQEMYRFLQQPPVEPKKYVREEEEKPKKKRVKKDGEVLQAD